MNINQSCGAMCSSWHALNLCFHTAMSITRNTSSATSRLTEERCTNNDRHTEVRHAGLNARSRSKVTQCELTYMGKDFTK
mmetsp:Transcript_31124/g.89793  ORF Transcript_31124/g.89793 Transcript_31124/m.89793 type:complete len:80 (-) Transcript_31124:1400-1639(-)